MHIERYHFSKINSTNTWAKENKELFNTECITLITAEEQLKSIGRYPNVWYSPPNYNVYASFCFYIDSVKQRLAFQQSHCLSHIMAISCAEILQDMDIDVRLKWPNDLIIAKKKLGGILSETIMDGGSLLAIVGIGININMPIEYLQKIDKPATSLLCELGREIPVEQIIQILQGKFVENLELFLRMGFEPFLEKFSGLLNITKNDPIRFHEGNTIYEGIFNSLNKDGSINIMLQNNIIKKCFSGEIN